MNGFQVFGVMLLLAGAVAIYFLPAWIAHARGHKSSTAIFILNFFFGWTLLGWVGALVWAYIGPDPALEALREPAPSTIKQCPYCAETIKSAAVICRFCNREVPAA